MRSFNPERPCLGLDITAGDIYFFLDVEVSHRPGHGYSTNKDNVLKRSKACALVREFEYNGTFDPVVSFLALNYYDNFISTHQVPAILDDPDEDFRLFVTCCFTLATKTLNPNCDITELLGFRFEAYDLYTMEHVIDRWLENRTCKRPITSLAYLDFFVASLGTIDYTQAACIRNTATQRAYAQQYDIESTIYKPSILAAAAILDASKSCIGNDYARFMGCIYNTEYLNKASFDRARQLGSSSNSPEEVVKNESDSGKGKEKEKIVWVETNMNLGLTSIHVTVHGRDTPSSSLDSELDDNNELNDDGSSSYPDQDISSSSHPFKALLHDKLPIHVEKPPNTNIESATLKRVQDLVTNILTSYYSFFWSHYRPGVPNPTLFTPWCIDAALSLSSKPPVYPSTPCRLTEINTIDPIPSEERAAASEDTSEERKPGVSSSIAPALRLDGDDLPPKKRRKNTNFDPENPCQGLSIKNQTEVERFFKLEKTHMPRRGYADDAANAYARLDVCADMKRYGSIGKCHPIVPFLAISYYDNFISTRDIPGIIDDELDNMGLFIISCFFSAWRTIYPDECNTFAFLLKLDTCYVTTSDVNAMERQIDRWLESRSCKRPITSLAFLDYFISNLIDADKPDFVLIKNFATHRAYAQQYKIEYTRYNPSILAATAIIYACKKLYKRYCDVFKDLISESDYVDPTSLEQALVVHEPQAGNVGPATLQKIQDSSVDLSNELRSNSTDHRPAPHDNKPVNGTSGKSLPQMLDDYFNNDDDDGDDDDDDSDDDDDDSDGDDDDEPFNERSTSALPDDEPTHDALSSLPRSPPSHDNEPIPSSSYRTQLLRDNKPTDDAPSSCSPRPQPHDNEHIDDAPSSPSLTQLFHDYGPIDDAPRSLPQLPPFYDNEPIDHAVPNSLTCGPLLQGSETKEEPTDIYLDLRNWSSEDHGPIHNVVQGAENLSSEACTTTNGSTAQPTTPHLRVTRSAIEPIESEEQAAETLSSGAGTSSNGSTAHPTTPHLQLIEMAAAENGSEHNITEPSANIRPLKKRRFSY